MWPVVLGSINIIFTLWNAVSSKNNSDETNYYIGFWVVMDDQTRWKNSKMRQIGAPYWSSFWVIFWFLFGKMNRDWKIWRKQNQFCFRFGWTTRGTALKTKKLNYFSSTLTSFPCVHFILGLTIVGILSAHLPKAPTNVKFLPGSFAFRGRFS